MSEAEPGCLRRVEETEKPKAALCKPSRGSAARDKDKGQVSIKGKAQQVGSSQQRPPSELYRLGLTQPPRRAKATVGQKKAEF